MPANTAALKRKTEVRESIYRKSTDWASYRLDGVCTHCRKTMEESEIKQAAKRLSEDSPTHFVPCKHCSKGKVDVNFVIRVKGTEGAVFHVFEYYSKEQLKNALIQIQQEIGYPRLDSLLSFAPDLLWSMTYHFGSYEKGIDVLQI